jgi:hypothetical protein
MAGGKLIEISFEGGGKFIATLLTKEAPKTCEAILKKLPIEETVYQAMTAGQELYFKGGFGVGFPIENAVKPKAGDVGYAVDQEWQNILIYYGDFITFPKYFTIFARITDNLEELLAVGRRVWTQGIEKVCVKEI